MSLYDDICEYAIGNYGLVTTAQAEALGVARKDICEWVQLGRLEKLGRGVYRIAHYLPSEYDRYAEAVALVGGDAAVWGESVLAMHNLALVNPLKVTVAVGRRVRKVLPEWIKLENLPGHATIDVFSGIRCQNLASAIRQAKGSMLSERLAEAVREAERRGLLRIDEAEKLKKEFAI